MNKNTAILSIFVAALSFASCQQQEALQSTDIENHRGVTISVSSPESRSSLVGTEFSWTAGDAASLFNSATDNSRLSYNQTEFIGEVLAPESDDYLYVIYPYSTANSISGSGTEARASFKQAVAQNQNFIEKAIDPTSIGNYLSQLGRTADVVKIEDGSNYNILLKQLCHVIDFNIKELGAGEAVKQVVLSNNKGGFISSVTSNITANGDALNLVSGDSKVENITVTINNGLGVESATDEMTVRIVLLPQTFEAGTELYFDIETSAGNYRHIKTVADETTIQAGELLSEDYTLVAEELFSNDYYVTASYARKMEIVFNSREAWTAVELSDSGDTFSVVSESGVAGDNLIINVSENTSTTTINSASFKVTTKSGIEAVIYIKQGEKLELKPFVESDWSIDSGAPVFDNGKWTLGTSAKIIRVIKKSAKVELSELNTPDSFVFFYQASGGSYRAFFFEIDNDVDDLLEANYYEYGDEEDNLTGEEQALVVKKVPYDNTKTNVLSIYNFPTPDGAVLQYYLNEELVTEVPAYMTEKALAGTPWRYTLRSYSGAATNSLLRWAESTVALDDSQWTDWSAIE